MQMLLSVIAAAGVVLLGPFLFLGVGFPTILYLHGGDR